MPDINDIIDELDEKELESANVCTDEEDNDMEVWYA